MVGSRSGEVDGEREKTITRPSEPPEMRVSPESWSWPTREVWPDSIAVHLLEGREGLGKG